MPAWDAVPEQECLVLVGNDIALDAVSRQFEPYPYRRMRLHVGGALVVRTGVVEPPPFY